MAFAICSGWIALCTLGYAYRHVWMGRSGPTVVIAGGYLCLCAATLFALGDGWQKWAGATVMTAPLMVAVLFVLE